MIRRAACTARSVSSRPRPTHWWKKIHDRMPVILAREDEEDWLHPQWGLDEAKAVLYPYPASPMSAYEVSTKVNSPAYNGPDLVKPS